MLKNYADNLIIPAYQDLETGIVELNSSAELFVANVNTSNLLALQEKWTSVYTQWQYCNVYNFGPAAEQGLIRNLSEEIATFPVSESKIETALANPNFNDFNRDSRGFLAIEYLIFKGTSDEIIALFANEHRKKYLTGLINNIHSRVTDVQNLWSSAYKSEFLAANGTDVGSSTSKLYNEFLKSFEGLKNLKVELPLGKRPGQTQAEPHLVEAYYSGKSLQFILAHITAIENIYYGKNKSGSDGLGLLDYLKSVEGGNDLATSAINQWSMVKSALSNIPNSSALSAQIISAPTVIETFGTELQKQTRYFKSDMSSLLGIAITYSSGDGD